MQKKWTKKYNIPLKFMQTGKLIQGITASAWSEDL